MHLCVVHAKEGKPELIKLKHHLYTWQLPANFEQSSTLKHKDQKI